MSGLPPGNAATTLEPRQVAAGLGIIELLRKRRHMRGVQPDDADPDCLLFSPDRHANNATIANSRISMRCFMPAMILHRFLLTTGY